MAALRQFLRSDAVSVHRVNVGSVGAGEPGSSPVKIIRGLPWEVCARSNQAAFHHPDQFKCFTMAFDNQGWLVVKRTDANHGWGANLQVQLLPKSTGAISKLEACISLSMAADTKRITQHVPLNGLELCAKHSACVHCLDQLISGVQYQVKGDSLFLTVVLPNASSKARTPLRFFLFNNQDCSSVLNDVPGFYVATPGDGSTLKTEFVFDSNEFGFIDPSRIPGVQAESIITEQWLSGKRDLLPECQMEMDKIIISRDVMAANPFQEMLQAVSDYADANIPLLSHVMQRLEVDALGEHLSHWRSDALIKASLILSKHGGDSVIHGLQDMIRVAVRMCQARRIDCFHQIVQAAYSFVSGKSAQINSAKEELTAILLKKLHQRKERAFKCTFIEPALAYYKRHRLSVEYNDVQVHGAQLYRSLLLATCGVIADTAPFLFDEAKAGPLFLSDPCFDVQARDFWAAKRAGNNYTFDSEEYCYRRPSEALFGDTCFEAVNMLLICPGSACHITPYLEAFFSYFTLSEAFLVEIVNQLVDNEALPLTQKVLQEICDKNCDAATCSSATHKSISRQDVLEYFWDTETYQVERPKLLELLVYLGIAAKFKS